MKGAVPAANPDAYVAALSGWRRTLVEQLRSNVSAAAKFDEVIKWGNLVYFSEGPVIVIRAEEKRVLFGFWRGKRLRDLDSRLKPGGKYEMATMALEAGDRVSPALVRRLARQAVALNRKLGDPTAEAGPRKRT
jgi:hypothetical protein